ncbi:transcription factor bHLH [Forsythia ovata]|uniref:Transcription factor bHLH n=1 Tax=Forsythia ovata TaxID=205694 RepID=A0ABD1RAU7_9LAMI
MHSYQKHFPEKPLLSVADQDGDYYIQDARIESFFNGRIARLGVKPFRPVHGVDFQPSEACPKNFVIFDQTYNRSQIMFHPDIGSEFLYPGFGVGAPDFHDGIDRKDGNVERESTSLKEDSDDINVLLSMEDEENENGDDEVSTGRTDANYGSNSPDSCSNYISLSEKSRSSFRKSSSDKKHMKLRKMVKALRGIVPGANRMSTVAVLDEAVRYLKSLQIKMLMPGVGSSKGCV